MTMDADRLKYQEYLDYSKEIDLTFKNDNNTNRIYLYLITWCQQHNERKLSLEIKMGIVKTQLKENIMVFHNSDNSI